MTRSCSTCQWWMPAHERASFGTCRAHPPSVDREQSAWPATDADEWCGVHRPAERLVGGDVRALLPDTKKEGAERG